MAIERKCAHCGETLARRKDPVRFDQCDRCGSVGLRWDVRATGSGLGKECPRCGMSRLHELINIQNDLMVHRCSMCGYTFIKPATR